jgi:D-glycerate 3-kinase
MKKNRLVAKVKDIEVLAKSLTDETLSLANSVPVEAGSDWRTLSILLTPFLSSDEIKIIGITGSQGSGKTTFAQSLVTSLRSRKPLTVSLSLDDFYLSKTARGELAESVHPLLATRGVPGTHETDLLEKVLNQVASEGMPKEISFPTFDKARDDRGPNKSAYVGKLVLEGWCLGAAAQSVQDLREPVNDLEREEDSSGQWRSWVNSQLQSRYHRLWQKVDFWIRLIPPSFTSVFEWRKKQEEQLDIRKRMSDTDLKRFIQHYERLTRWQWEGEKLLPGLEIHLDENHRVSDVR